MMKVDLRDVGTCECACDERAAVLRKVLEAVWSGVELPGPLASMVSDALFGGANGDFDNGR